MFEWITPIITDSQWVTAIVTLFAVIVALFGKEFMNWKNRPKIKLNLSNREPHVITIYGDSINKYFRLKIINNGETVAKNCQIKILSVIPENGNSKYSIIEQDILKWSNAPYDMRYSHKDSISKFVPIHRERMNISPKGGWELCDLFQITGGNNLMFLSSGGRTASFKNESYIVTIEISGENIKPEKAKFRISNPNSFEHIRIDWV